MDSAEILATSTIKTQKRTTNERKSENANEMNVSIDDEDIKKLKRFKCINAETPEYNLITNAGNSNVIARNFLSKNAQNFPNENAISVLSPIAEISNNLSEAYLNAEVKHDDTPIKKNENSFASRKMLHYYGKNIFNKNITNDKADVMQKEKEEKEQHGLQQHSNFEVALSTNQKHLDLAKHQKITTTIIENPYQNEMTTVVDNDDDDDETTLYADDDPIQANDDAFIAYNSHAHAHTLLPDEPTTQRFKIVKKFMGKNNNKSNRATTSSSIQRTTRNDLQNETQSSQLRVFHSLSSTCSIESSTDDEYMEFFEMESLDDGLNINLPRNLNSLINGKIQNSPPQPPPTTTATATSPNAHAFTIMDKTASQRISVRRCLSMSIENDHRYKNQLKNDAVSKENVHYNFKRPEPPLMVDSSPLQNKRQRANDKENFNCNSAAGATKFATFVGKKPTLTKSFSMNDTEIMLALARAERKDEPDLVGDFSRPFALPLIKGQHSDLKTISSETVARLIKGDYDEQIECYKIIDCRYPYEYDGGHIRGAINLYMQNQILAEFLQLTKTEQHEQQMTEKVRRNIIIFHCEFSSERGPKLLRFLRNTDRTRNINSYPALDYPEIYLLHNGYKEFYEMHSELCVPSAYRPMLEPAYNAEYKHFRSKSKSWNGECISTSKKHSSRLML